MIKFLTLATATLLAAAPARADDDTRNASKGAQWFPGGGYGWNAGPTDARPASTSGWDRDNDGDHDRWDHRGGRDNSGSSSQLLNRWALVNFDFNRDRRLDPREYALSKRAFYDLADRNSDGYISDKDWRKFVDRYAYRTDIGYRYGSGHRDHPRYGYNNDPWRR